MVYEVKQPETVAGLFAGWQETMIWSCLQNVMGQLYAVSGDGPAVRGETVAGGCAENAGMSGHPGLPSAAMALLGDFCFFAGQPDRELTEYGPPWRRQDFLILVPQTPAWGEMIRECYGSRAKKVTRYAIRKEPDVFDEAVLMRMARELPGGYQLRQIDEELFRRCLEIPWCRDLVAQYRDYAQYREYGLGMVILRDGEIVSGAGSYSGYRGGIEIEVDTKAEYRRRGLAGACCARLILECRKRGWYASWDAQNLWSVALAQKLGYHPDHEYVCYEIRRD